MAIKVRQTITDELFTMWGQCRRRGDTKKIKEFTGYSLPVIERALNSGFVAQEGLSDRITEFFTNRLAESQAGTDKLKSMLNENDSATQVLH